MLRRSGALRILIGSWIVCAGLAPVSTAAPDAEHLDGFDPARYRGQVVLLDFWASWCAPCRASFPWMADLAERYGERGLVVVTVNLDEDPAAADAFLESLDVDSGSLVDLRDPEGILAERYGLGVMPTSILFDRDGTPAFVHDGFHPESVGEYEAHVVALLEGQTATAAVSLETEAPRRVGVRPWERGILARNEMQLVSDPLEIEFDDHIYFSKEASSGGRGFGGGGCGCN